MKLKFLARWLMPLLLTQYAFAGSKALLVGIDGVQYEKLQALDTPNFNRLTITKAYTGGITRQNSEQLTSSGPGWATILTGVWVDKHQVVENGSGLANPQFPSIFKRIAATLPEARTASIINWSPINTQYFTNDLDTVEVVLNGLNDDAVVEKTIEFINSGGDFTFVHLDEPDGVGHSTGFGGLYNNSLIKADTRLGLLLDAVEKEQARSGDDWLILVTTDHGRDSFGYNHGKQTTSEKTIFIASNQPMNEEFTTPVNPPANTDFNGLYGFAAQTSIVPTLLRHLGIEPEREWLLDGIPLNGKLAVRKLEAGNGSDLQWVSQFPTEVDIFRNGNLAATVPATLQQWNDPAIPTGSVDYVVLQNKTPAAVRSVRLDITAGLDWDPTRAYFFRNDQQYIRYAKVLDRADSGYPKTTSNSTWPGLEPYRDDIVASFRKDTGTSYFFLKDGSYINYDNTLDKARSDYPRPVNDANWPGLAPYGKDIIATLRLPGNKVYFFLNNGSYLRYDLNRDRVDNGYPKAVNNHTWPGLEPYAKEITAAIQWSDQRAYFFLTGQRYIRYSISDDRADSGYPQKVNNATWQGLMKP